MNCKKEQYLRYSACEAMDELRGKFNAGESIEKETPESISLKEAIGDIEYLQFVMENGYSGYQVWGREKFDEAFEKIKQEISTQTEEITPIQLLNTISAHINFITDGHLALTCEGHAVGFYRLFATYVSEYRIEKVNGKYLESETKNKIQFDEQEVEVFPSGKSKESSYYLIGKRSYDKVESIAIWMNGELLEVPVHPIRSTGRGASVNVEFREIDGIGYVRSSTFVGDKTEELDEIYKVGKHVSKYPNVIWDISNNTGGNSEFVKRFIEGLNGHCKHNETVYQVSSGLVEAKSTGQIKEIPYELKKIQQTEETINPGSYEGHLHIIINDKVASSAEMVISMTSNIKNRTTYGCHTLGIGRYGDLLIYYLPHSKATVWCPHKIFENGIEETKGYAPDIWLDSEQILEQVLKIIKR